MDGYGNFPITSEALSGPIRITEIAGFIFVPFLMWTSSGRNDLLFLNPTLKSNFSRHQLGISLGWKTLTLEVHPLATP